MHDDFILDCGGIGIIVYFGQRIADFIRADTIQVRVMVDKHLDCVVDAVVITIVDRIVVVVVVVVLNGQFVCDSVFLLFWF